MIPDGATLGLFVLAALALLAVPGPAVLYIVARSIDQGRTAGAVSMLGIHVGSLVHVAAAALGISSLLVSSAVAFSVVKYAGAAYLIFLGVRALVNREADDAAGPRGKASLQQLFRQGVIVNVLNPKTALFFFAFLPQFVDPRAAHPAVQMLVLGLLFVVIAALSDGMYALAAGSAAGMIRGARWFGRAQRYVTASVFIGLGVATAFAGSRRSS